MLDDNYLMLGPKVDLKKVEKISTKRLASFLDFYITRTVSFLNQFSSTCEEKLNRMDAKIQDLEVLLVILESKLSSVPGLDELKALPATATPSSPLENTEAEPQSSEPSIPMEEKTGVANKDNPVYKKYFGMVKVGIPIEAVKQKMAMENLDQNILDFPDELGEMPVEEE